MTLPLDMVGQGRTSAHSSRVGSEPVHGGAVVW